MRAKLSNLQSIPQVVAEMTLDEKFDMVGSLAPVTHDLSRIWMCPPSICWTRATG